jgi:hypothetical protein
MHPFNSRDDSEAHNKFIEWIQKNPTGYVGSKEKEVMLHRATCLHFPPYEGYGRAKNSKHCSLYRNERETWPINRDLILRSSCM